MVSFVATSGRQFEQKVWESESGNPKFGFIQPTHHYHAYYLQQLQQPQEQEQEKDKPGILSDQFQCLF